jgi:hypothetical protein
LFATGDQFTYMVDEDVCYSWRDNEEGQLGLSEPSMVIDPIPLVEDVAAIAAGSVHAFVLLEDGTLWATGFNGDAVWVIGRGKTATNWFWSKIRLLPCRPEMNPPPISPRWFVVDSRSNL